MATATTKAIAPATPEIVRGGNGEGGNYSYFQKDLDDLIIGGAVSGTAENARDQRDNHETTAIFGKKANGDDSGLAALPCPRYCDGGGGDGILPADNQPFTTSQALGYINRKGKQLTVRQPIKPTFPKPKGTFKGPK